jgi:hypothetical protein
MIPYVAAAIAGAFLATRNAPKSRIQKMTCFGPRSGIVYQVDLVANLGIAIIHAPNGTSAVFQQKPPPDAGFIFVRGAGSEAALAAMKKDLEV